MESQTSYCEKKCVVKSFCDYQKSILCDLFGKTNEITDSKPDREGCDPFPCTPDIDPSTGYPIVPSKKGKKEEQDSRKKLANDDLTTF